MSKNIKIYRNGSWFDGAYLDAVTFPTEYDNINDIYQLRYYLEDKCGYTIKDLGNNPFSKTQQFVYMDEDDEYSRVIVRFDYGERRNWLIVEKEFLKLEECQTTESLISRLQNIQPLFDNVLKIFKTQYESHVKEGDASDVDEYLRGE